MSFAFGEFEVSQRTLGEVAALLRKVTTKVGQRHILLDSVRDADFLASPSIANPDGSHDGGLGSVDNGFFWYGSRIDPATKEPRQFPVKFFWLGTPKGTGAFRDNFSLYVADVQESNFYPGALAAAWLQNPRLALSIQQAKEDIIGWFGSNYPGGATGGIGNSNAGENNQYGALAGGVSPVGDVSKMNTLVQVHPIYDRVDNTCLLYFSMNSPNINTLAIYAYKGDPEFSSAFASDHWIGGLNGAAWLGAGVPNDNGAKAILSSPRFSITSPDPYFSSVPVAGRQTAILLYSYGSVSPKSPNHGRLIIGSMVSDIHAQPLAPSSIAFTCPSAAYKVQGGYGLDVMAPLVDKLGNIFPTPIETVAGAHAFVYSGPSVRDIRGSSTTISDSVVLSSIQIFVGFVHFYSGTLAVKLPGISVGNLINRLGECRPQFSTFPDETPKILYGDFKADGYVSIGFQYIDEEVLYPGSAKELIVPSMTLGTNGGQGYLYTFGKRNASIYGGGLYPSNPIIMQVDASMYPPENSTTWRQVGNSAPTNIPQMVHPRIPSSFGLISGTPLVDLYPILELEDLQPLLLLDSNLPAGIGIQYVKFRD